jgi:hypothetical protein
MARLCCFYNNLDPRVEAALNKYAPLNGLEVEWVDTNDPENQKYADELEKRWTGEEDLILVEQDKEIHTTVLPSLLTCDSPWCAYVFWINPEPHTTLAVGPFGVTRFSAQLQRMVPVAAFRGPAQGGIDRRFGDYLMRTLGVGACLHGHVVHHHVYEPRPRRVREYVKYLRNEGVLPPALYPPAPGPHLLPGSYDLNG